MTSKTSRPTADVERSIPGLRALHLSHNDQMGGGPLASYRLHRALLDLGLDSRMLVMRRYHDEATVARSAPWPTRLIEAPARIADRLPLRLYPKRRRDMVWSPGWFAHANLSSNDGVREADLLSLYWINGGFLSIAGVKSLLDLGKPVVWRLSRSLAVYRRLPSSRRLHRLSPVMRLLPATWRHLAE